MNSTDKYVQNETEANFDLLKKYKETLNNSLAYAEFHKKIFISKENFNQMKSDLNNNGNKGFQMSSENFQDFTANNFKKDSMNILKKECCNEEKNRNITRYLQNNSVIQHKAVIVCPSKSKLSNIQESSNNFNHEEVIYRPIPQNIIEKSFLNSLSLQDKFVEQKNNHVFEQMVLHKKNPEKIGLLTFFDNKQSLSETTSKDISNVNPNIIMDLYENDVSFKTSILEEECLKMMKMTSRRTSAPACLLPSTFNLEPFCSINGISSGCQTNNSSVASPVCLFFLKKKQYMHFRYFYKIILITYR